MTIADENQNPRPTIKLNKSLETIAALRSAMERRMAEPKKEGDGVPRTASKPEILAAAAKEPEIAPLESAPEPILSEKIINEVSSTLPTPSFEAPSFEAPSYEAPPLKTDFLETPTLLSASAHTQKSPENSLRTHNAQRSIALLEALVKSVSTSPKPLSSSPETSPLLSEITSCTPSSSSIATEAPPSEIEHAIPNSPDDQKENAITSSATLSTLKTIESEKVESKASGAEPYQSPFEMAAAILAMIPLAEEETPNSSKPTISQETPGWAIPDKTEEKTTNAERPRDTSLRSETTVSSHVEALETPTNDRIVNALSAFQDEVKISEYPTFPSASVTVSDTSEPVERPSGFSLPSENHGHEFCGLGSIGRNSDLSHQTQVSEKIVSPIKFEFARPRPSKLEEPILELPGDEISSPVEAISSEAKSAEKSSPKDTEAPRTSSTASPNEEVSADPLEWSRVLFRIADRSQKIAQTFLNRNEDVPPAPLPFDPAHISEALFELTGRILNDPERFAEAQLALWQGYIRLWQSTLARAQGKEEPPIITPAPSDKRFQDKDWQNVWMFDFFKQSYLLTADWVHKLIQRECQELDPKLAGKLKFFTQQIVDAVSPSNFWMTNPEVLRTTLESGGENLVKGLEHLLEDLENGHGMLNISMSDTEAFKVGKNLGATPGRVIFQNELMQLIQYEPQTPQVQRVPLLIIPPWINKFYILDLREKNSFIRHLVAEGYTVFCISWVNPGAQQALINFDDYMSLGALTALREIKRHTGEESVNVLGYCIGGTLLASTLAYLEAVKTPIDDLPKVESATYLVTMVDFKDPGDLGVFIDDDQVQAIEARMAKLGYLDAASLATTFNLLRSNDLVWSFVVNNYLLGREPFPFDILYWNTDSTNLPAVMHSFYLRKMYLMNKLVEADGLTMKNVPIDLRRIKTPSFLLSTQDDHIAPWRSTYEAMHLYQGPTKFVLAGSGHIAGVINPPAANKYGYWTNDNHPQKADEWLADAEQHRGSWWPYWLAWLKERSGTAVPPRQIGVSLENAPGSYVMVRAL